MLVKEKDWENIKNAQNTIQKERRGCLRIAVIYENVFTFSKLTYWNGNWTLCNIWLHFNIHIAPFRKQISFSILLFPSRLLPGGRPHRKALTNLPFEDPSVWRINKFSYPFFLVGISGSGSHCNQTRLIIWLNARGGIEEYMDKRITTIWKSHSISGPEVRKISTFHNYGTENTTSPDGAQL